MESLTTNQNWFKIQFGIITNHQKPIQNAVWNYHKSSKPIQNSIWNYHKSSKKTIQNAVWNYHKSSKTDSKCNLKLP